MRSSGSRLTFSSGHQWIHLWTIKRRNRSRLSIPSERPAEPVPLDNAKQFMCAVTTRSYVHAFTPETGVARRGRHHVPNPTMEGSVMVSCALVVLLNPTSRTGKTVRLLRRSYQTKAPKPGGGRGSICLQLSSPPNTLA